MLTDKRLLFMFTETSLHAGTGAQLGAVDLPIQRERHTGYPILQGSGLKGALRADARRTWKGDAEKRDQDGGDAAKLYAAFGPPTDEADKHGGAVAFGDARVLLFPARAPGSLYVWATCRDLLARVAREVGAGAPALPDLGAGEALVSHGGRLSNGAVLIEEFAYKASEDQKLKNWAEWLATHALPAGSDYEPFRSRLKDHLVLLADGEFQDLVLAATEIVTRVRLNPAQKTVQEGALWTEEALPADTLLYAPVQAGPPTRKNGTGWKSGGEVLGALEQVIGKTVQIGGDETTGRGWVSLRWHAPAAAKGGAS